MMRETEDWRYLAACGQTDPEVFFPEKGARTCTREALRVCSTCMVRAECLVFALEYDLGFGVWGGTTERERRALRRRAREAPAAVGQ